MSKATNHSKAHNRATTASTTPSPKSRPATKRPVASIPRRYETGKSGLSRLSAGHYWFIGLVIVAALIGGSFLVGGNSSDGPTGVNARTLAVGSAAPTFSGTDVITGKKIDSATLAGKNVLYFINSGSTCQACMVQAQALQRDQSLLGRAHITLVMVTNDQAPALLAAAHAFSLTIPMVADPTGALTSRFGAIGGGMNMGVNEADHSFILVNKAGIVLFHQDFLGMWITPTALISHLPKMS